MTKKRTPSPSASSKKPRGADEESRDIEILPSKAPAPKALVSRDTRSALTTTDPLSIYMKEVARYPLLSLEEERALFEKLLNENDLDAAKKLVSSNLRLVVKIAMEYRTAYHNLLDLIQEGNIGLMKAVSMYDPNKGARLSYYASWWIRSYILKYILDNFRLVKVGTTQEQRKLFYNLMREKEKIEAMGHYAGAKLLSERLGVSEGAVIEMDRRLSSSDVSLDAPLRMDEKSDRVIDTMGASDETRPDRAYETEEMANVMHKLFDQFASDLNERDKVILSERLLSEVPRTLDDLATQYSISKERARQLEANILKKLKSYLAQHKIDISVLQ